MKTFAAIIALLIAIPAHATTFNVDIGEAGFDNEPGFLPFEGPFTAGNADISNGFTTDLGRGGDATVTVLGANAFRDRPTQVTGTLGNLAESFHAHQDEQTLRLTDLIGGTYQITSYHHDSENSQGDLGVRLTDANATNLDLGLTIAQSTGTSSANLASETFNFTAAGTPNGNVDITYYETSPAGATLLNGFAIQPDADDLLNVDIGSTGHDLQDGFLNFQRGQTAPGGPQSETYLASFGIDDQVTVTLGDGVVFRDRDETTHPLGDLAESFHAHQDQLDLLLENLTAGRYRIKTYHHDTNNQQATLGVRLTEARFTNMDLGLSLLQSTGTTPSNIASFEFEFIADGLNPVALQFYEQVSTGSQSIIINGFELTAVPEPATAALLALATAPLLRRRVH